MSKPILVTTALPYANGPIHLGHLVEYIQADIWVRAQKMDGREITFVCADDAHGTAIMLKAESEKITAEELINRVRAEHLQDFNEFGVVFDNYHSTHSPENQYFSNYIYNHLREQKLIDVREVEQYFDTVKSIFLPDRFIKGTCPKCKADNQYGDSCEACGAAYTPTELINPYSTISQSAPILKKSAHYFFRLSDDKCKNFLQEWTRSGTLQPEAANKVGEWLISKDGKQTLSDWDISRDAPYFGFKIPQTPEGEDKYFYVWLDAPIGYIASYANYLIKQHPEKKSAELINVVEKFMASDSTDKTELYHFIGKDILYFHALFWPAMLKFSGLRTPSALYVHGFLTINGQKMSKSRGTFITARHYLDCGINPEFLRYFFATRVSPKIEDIDLSLVDFEQKINSDLVGKLVNIASRAAPFLQNKFAGEILNSNIDEDFYTLLPEFKTLVNEVRQLYINLDFSKAMRLIMQGADSANKYCDEVKPWELAKKSGGENELHLVCSVLINAFRLLVICLKPTMPKFCASAENLLNINSHKWSDGNKLLPPSAKINNYSHLLKRLDSKEVQKLTSINNDTKIIKPTNIQNQQNIMTEKIPTANINMSSANSTIPTDVKNENPYISIDDVMKLDLRVALIETAEAIPTADKLVRLGINVGKKADGSDDKRTIFAGIKQFYSPEKLIGKKIVVVANLAPRKMRFGISEGMLLAASFPSDDSGVYVIEPDGGVESGAQVGMKVK